MKLRSILNAKPGSHHVGIIFEGMEIKLRLLLIVFAFRAISCLAASLLAFSGHGQLRVDNFFNQNDLEFWSVHWME